MDPLDPQLNLNWYMSCFVPTCKNTTSTTPEKIFIRVPNNPVKRKVWCDAVGFDTAKKLRKTGYCCADHFDLENDMKNYTEFLQFGGKKFLKDHVVPRFNLKLLKASAQSSMDVDGRSETDDHSTQSSDRLLSTASGEINLLNVFNSKTSPLIKLYTSTHVQVKPATSNKWSQTVEPEEEKPVRTTIRTRSSGLNTNMAKQSNDLKKNGIGLNKKAFGTPTTCMNTSNEEKKMSVEPLENVVYESFTKKLIESDPLLYLGIRKESMYIIDLLHTECEISVRDIYLTLKKVKLNPPFSVLAHEFGLSEDQAIQIFEKSVKTLAVQLKQLIVWPSREQIMLNLPVHFRHEYSDIESIVDCFEIEIEKPSNAYNQESTWSDSKKCHTIKYLVSVTADSLINFISEGVCGKCTYISLAENCGFLDVLPENAKVMADQHFKQLAVRLTKKKCTLIEFPPANLSTHSKKIDGRLPKQIANLRTHLESVINRLRNFKFMDIYSRVDNKLLDFLDSAIFIASGLVNLQSNVIK